MTTIRGRILTTALLFMMAATSSFADDPVGANSATDAQAKVADGQSVTEPPNKSMGNDSATECIKKAESGGDYSSVNTKGFMGAYQIGEGKLIDLGYAKGVGSKTADNDNKNIMWTGKDGINSVQDFLANHSLQDSIKDKIDNLNTKSFSSATNSMVGKTIDCTPYGGAAATSLTQSMLVQGAQFGAGKVNAWAAAGGSCNVDNTHDGNGNCVTWGMCKSAGCSDIKKDMSKQTCSVTMPMIKAINCSNFTGDNLALCNAAKPYLMTDGECAAAEDMAKAATKGPNENKCENSTFGPGTGSWSYALACSYSSSAVADQDGASNPNSKATSGPMPLDMECFSKLDAMGVTYTKQGDYNNGTSAAGSCLIQNSLTMRGTALPFGATLQFNCDMALVMEQFGQKLKAIGITGYYDAGSVRECGPRRDKNGDKKGTITNHALGRAFDYNGFIYQGRKISMGKVWEPGTPDGQLALQVKAISCSTFLGVLSPTYKGYAGHFFHNHVEQADGHFCD